MQPQQIGLRRDSRFTSCYPVSISCAISVRECVEARFILPFGRERKLRIAALRLRSPPKGIPARELLRIADLKSLSAVYNGMRCVRIEVYDNILSRKQNSFNDIRRLPL